MKQLTIAFCICLLYSHFAFSQNRVTPAMLGFDIVREGIPHGKIDPISYNSKAVGTNRKALIYTPPGYSKDKKYPELYILHGGGEDQRGWATQGKPDLIIDNLISQKKAVPMIVVMVDGNLPLNGFGGETLSVFEKELKQSILLFVEQNYRVKTDANSRALAGLSMGGIHTLYTGVKNTDLFSYLGYLNKILR